MKKIERNVDWDLLVRLINDAKGEDRSFREFAREGGFSRNHLCLLKGRTFKPGYQYLFNFVSEKAKPRNGVTMTDLMKAAGYPDLDYEPLALVLNQLADAIAA